MTVHGMHREVSIEINASPDKKPPDHATHLHGKVRGVGGTRRVAMQS
jgi:hypothetical protein